MRRQDGWIMGRGGTRLYWRSWTPAGAAVADVAVLHGLGDHGERWARLAADLVDRGVAVHALDLRGHGRSEGTRALIDDLDDVHADIGSYLDAVASRSTGDRLFLLGHSWGGLAALVHTLRRPAALRGLVLSAPAARLAATPSRARLAAARVLSRVAPGLRVARIDATKVSRDPAVVAEFASDPLVFRGGVRAATAWQTLVAMREVAGGLHRLELPILVQYGSDDRITDPACGPFVCEQVGSADATLKIYDGLWHQLYNEPERDAVIDDLVAWLREHSR